MDTPNGTKENSRLEVKREDDEICERRDRPAAILRSVIPECDRCEAYPATVLNLIPKSFYRTRPDDKKKARAEPKFVHGPEENVKSKGAEDQKVMAAPVQED